MRTVGYIPGKKAKTQKPKEKGGNGVKTVTKADVIEKLTAAGIEFDKDAKLEDLIALLPAD